MHLPLARALANVRPWGVCAFGCTFEIIVGFAKHAEKKVEIFHFFLFRFSLLKLLFFFLAV